MKRMSRLFWMGWALVAVIVVLITAGAVQQSVAAGHVGGPMVHHDTVLAHHADVYTEGFTGGEEAKVFVLGDDPADDVDLEVIDEHGNVVESNYCPGSAIKVTWTPKWTGEFKLRVKNCEAKDVGYRIGVE